MEKMNCNLSFLITRRRIGVIVFHISVVVLLSSRACVGLADRSNGLTSENSGSHGDPRPCCLPYRFQAVITNLATFSAEKKEVSRLYRDWENKLQIQETVTFTNQGIRTTTKKLLMDYKNMVQYLYASGETCQHFPLDHGMLEPCMPESSTYLGKSYIGAYGEQTHFDAWYFRRANLNRDIEMTIIVTSDRCVPISEHIIGRMGGGSVDALVFFTNVTENVDEAAFHIPLECLNTQPM